MVARGMVVQTDHPHAGPTRAIGCPVHLSMTPARVDRPAPLFGEHTREVLSESGFEAAEIDELLREGVVAEVQRTAAAS
jgi:crotonobetainyl-CoA:carnitine CoA-transferase CaiB-like acyl-CoA transferase